MDKNEPTSYDAALSGGLTASAPSINEVFPSNKSDLAASAPSINEEFASDKIGKPASSSYVNEGYGADYDVFRPPTPPPPAYIDIPQILLPNFSGLTNKAIRDACYEYVEEASCYGSKAIKDMIISNIHNSCSLHYRLESYGEKRQSRDKEVPYEGQYIDGPENGPAPGPWDMAVVPSAMFHVGNGYLEIPHTAVVKQCWRCNGCGKMDCSSCRGKGKTSCSCSNGRDRNGSSCSWCGGSGKRRCSWCHGSGRVTCSSCEGHGNLKHYRELVLTWTTHIDDFITNAMNLPKELILIAPGEQIFKEECPVVSPISQSPDELVNDASHQFIDKHRRDFPNELILMQRQTLRAIPNTRIKYSWRRKEGEFYVYSFEKKVYFENYPQKCCCICC